MARILLIGPDRERTGGIRSLLRHDGHQVDLFRQVDGWREQEWSSKPDLIVATVEAAEPVLSDPGPKARGFPAPLLIVQHEADFFHDYHLDERLVDRLSSPFMSEDLLGRVDALIRVRRVIQRDPSVVDEEGPAESGGLGGKLAALLGSRIPRYVKPLGSYLEVATRVANWADRRDAFEPGHAERVTTFCALIAESLNLDDHATGSLLRAAMLHDIGKIALPVEMLHQTSPLEANQMRLIRTHPRRGVALLRALDRDDEVANVILHHHERPDGEGYYGVAGDEIPVAARILAVAEVFDAMTKSRVREPLPTESALMRLREARGTLYDGDCVDALVDRMKPRAVTIPLMRPV
jgi:putative nucleotidyltransferase with HDIG domain